MHEYDKMLQWVSDGGGKRYIKIEMGKPDYATYVSKWAYDYELGVGQIFDSVDDINLEREKEKEEYEKYIKLKKKFEEGE